MILLDPRSRLSIHKGMVTGQICGRDVPVFDREAAESRVTGVPMKVTYHAGKKARTIRVTQARRRDA